MFLNDIEQLRAIQWDKSWLWDICFPDAPPPFGEFFPAQTCKVNLATIQSFQIDAPLTQHKVPWMSSPYEISLTFYDDVKIELLTWLAKWINSIVNTDKGYVLPIASPGVCRTLQVAKLNTKRELISLKTYLVFPDGGALDYEGDSNSDSPLHSYTFTIAKLLSDDGADGEDADLGVFNYEPGSNAEEAFNYMPGSQGVVNKGDMDWDNPAMTGYEPSAMSGGGSSAQSMLAQMKNGIQGGMATIKSATDYITKPMKEVQKQITSANKLITDLSSTGRKITKQVMQIPNTYNRTISSANKAISNAKRLASKSSLPKIPRITKLKF